MKKKIYRKYLGIGVIILFIWACVIPSISGNFEKNINDLEYEKFKNYFLLNIFY